jgi:hypothetical protein
MAQYGTLRIDWERRAIIVDDTDDSPETSQVDVLRFLLGPDREDKEGMERWALVYCEDCDRVEFDCALGVIGRSDHLLDLVPLIERWLELSRQAHGSRKGKKFKAVQELRSALIEGDFSAAADEGRASLLLEVLTECFAVQPPASP